MNEFSFPSSGSYTEEGLSYALKKTLPCKLPVVVCVGTDALIGDSLGPMVGTILKDMNLPLIIYGSLDKPVTAKEVTFVTKFIARAHPYSKVLVVDAAVGKLEEVGRIKIIDKGLKPGLGAEKDLPLIGDASIIGVVAEKSPSNRALMSFTRLGFVSNMAKLIASAIQQYATNNAYPL